MAIDFNNAIPLLQVYDVPISIAFYRDVLGFEVLQTSKPFDDAKDNYGWAMLRKNNVYLMLNNMFEDNMRPSMPDATRTQNHRDTTLYLSSDPDAAYEYLQAKGVAVKPPVDAWYGMRQCHVSDPDGYSLVFQKVIDEK
jgi:glyoxylase I family protein